jgi:hypothetical protein
MSQEDLVVSSCTDEEFRDTLYSNPEKHPGL